MMKRSRLKRQRAENFGQKGEFFAFVFLRLKFYSILARNYKTPFGEIDLIVKKGANIAFVEVKTRRNKNQYGDALLAVNQRRIIRAANHYLMYNPHLSDNDLRFDVIFLAPNSFPRHLIGAFDAFDNVEL